MRATKTFLLAAVLASCHGPPVGPAVQDDGGAPSGAGGASGAVGTGGAGAGGAGAANACARCETACTDGVCELAVIRMGGGGQQLSATSVVLDGDRLYFAAGPGSIEVRSIPKQGGPETVLYTPHACSGCTPSIAVDGSDVFFIAQNVAQTRVILAVPKDGGSERTVATSVNALLAIDGAYVYWYSGTGIQRALKSGGASEPAAAASGTIMRLAASPGRILWADRDTGVVTRLDTATLTPHVLGVTPNPQPVLADGVGDVADDGTRAFWVLASWPYTVYAEGTGNTPTELARAVAGSAPAEPPFDLYGSIAVDGDYVYFTEAGLLNRVRKTGGPVETRAFVRVSGALGEFVPRIVGFDDRYVYVQEYGPVLSGLFRVVK